jgi:hypothetical protein
LVPRADATCDDCLSLLDEVLFVDAVYVLSLPDNRSRALRKLTSRPVDGLEDDIVVIELLPFVSIPCTPLVIFCLSSSVDGAELAAMTDLSMVMLVTPIVFVVVELLRLESTCSTPDEELSVDELTFTSRLSSLSLAVEDDVDTPPSAIVILLLRCCRRRSINIVKVPNASSDTVLSLLDGVDGVFMDTTDDCSLLNDVLLDAEGESTTHA